MTLIRKTAPRRGSKALALAAAGVLALSAGTPALAQAKTEFSIAWSIYVGWMPWGYMADHGIMDKWAEKYGITVEIVQINDYIESINQYTAGAFDGVSATNMDTLSIPAGGGVDTTALIVGDYSNGNDAILVKGEGATVEDLAGKPVNLVELSVSHYLLARALEKAGLAERDLGAVINTSDADMVAAWQTSDVEAVVTWNPLVSTILEMGDAVNVADSSDIPGEIIDLLAVNTEVLEANPAFGKAVVGAWYETMALMSSDTEEGAAARAAMGEASGTDQAGYEAQLDSTAMFYEPSEAVAFVEDPKLAETMTYVAQFLFDKGILGTGAPSPDFVGVAYPSGQVTGDEGNVKFRYSVEYMKMAADGLL
ncbi:putative urea ABC transporter substrate-binding protein [Albimonas pacifica]|uniref:NitT/TauT family transport system substrate-binding protein n=1 Tax=Albimonas pacifica TaxID=1114924 RepID=A0A1I3CVW1_9RHOB|nr:putative urea ABC transporter substrate-binding protein [Albimonas pacifica]SFH78652.1 NitT/TauT family transport system substrate-binding protein [Albimonas pacifica]